MQPSEQDLKEHFAGLSDEALLQQAAAAGDLTPLAHDVLRSEVAGRRLTMPSVEPEPAELPSRDDERIVTIRRFRDLSEAIVARAALEGASIPCFLRNEHTVRIDWQISNAIGGIRLDVLELDADAAEEVLLPIEAGVLTVGEDGEMDEASQDFVCPKCGSPDVHRKHRWGGLAMASILMIGIPLPRGPREWRCDACDARWMDEGVSESTT